MLSVKALILADRWETSSELVSPVVFRAVVLVVNANLRYIGNGGVQDSDTIFITGLVEIF